MTAPLQAIVREHGTPAFVYVARTVRERVEALRAALGGRLGVRYAAKANPHPALLRRMAALADGLDVSSGAEIARGRAAGFAPGRMGFTGPVKSDADLEAAAREGVAVVLESVEEARALDGIVRTASLPPARVLVRISPDRVPTGFAVRMAGRPTRFGVDEGDLARALPEIAARPGLALVGFHAFPGTQCLDAAAVAAAWLASLELFRRAAGIAAIAPELLILGSGLGIPCHEGDEPVDLDVLAARTGPAFSALPDDPILGRARIEIETGRFLVGEAGVYLARVERVKRSRGRDIALLDGGMHHHLAAAGHLGGVIPRNYPVRRLRPAAPGEEEIELDLAGPLCTSIDTLGRAVRLPPLRAGDVLVFGASGAYGPTASPLHFLSRPFPKELLVEEDGSVVDIGPESTFRAPE